MHGTTAMRGCVAHASIRGERQAIDGHGRQAGGCRVPGVAVEAQDAKRGRGVEPVGLAIVEDWRGVCQVRCC